MALYDLCVRSEEAAGFAKKLGWDGIGLITTLKDFKGPGVKKPGGLDISLGVEIEVKRASDLRKIVKRLRRKAELVVIKGGNLDVNRAALEIPEVDILTGFCLPGSCGLNHIMAKLAAKNNVSIGFEFGDILHSHEKSRTSILSMLLHAAKLVRKFRAPFILTSGALSPWDLRAPSELQAFGRVLGFKDPEIKKALGNGIVEENRKRLSGKWIMPGVEVE
jgi:ribonuclease P/MRP protein subunit RPP1